MTRPRAPRFAPVVLLAAALAASCGGGQKTPTTERLPNAASLIPEAPAPQPTPTPTPGATPDDAPIPAKPGHPGGGGGDGTGGCGAPTPPALARINVKVQNQSSDRTLLDATPLVGPDAAYCRQIGYADGRSFCPVRPDGHPERVACETLLVGMATDTGRAGPTWSADGKPCTGPGGGAYCVNHSDNQYLAFAFGAGVFRACAESGLCGEITLH
ncbi:MAG TPA: hypothetical protein VL691_02745 [Vicinamibacteria bacterium]|nr:hypothetical protein [Vicinamibacteria bacterium]